MKLLKTLTLLLAISFIFAGCASEIEAPVEPDVPKGVITPVEDDFMASIGDTSSTHYFVYTPPDYDPSRATGYPVFYMLHGFGGNEAYFVSLFSATGAADWLLARDEIDEMILVFPSGHTQMGGSFYTNSAHPTVGQSEQHILDIAAAVDAAYNTIEAPAGRAIGGHSMGGYGALSIAMNNPGLFGAVSATGAPLTFWGTKTAPPHEDDTYAGIEELLPAALLETGYAQVLAETGGAGDAEQYQQLMAPAPDRTVTSMMFGMAAAFSPTDPANPIQTSIEAYGVDLPIGIDGGLYMDTWTRWLQHDLLSRFSGGQAAALGGVKIWLDAGLQDDLGLYGALDVFVGAMTQANMPPDHHSKFEPVMDAEGDEIPADHSTYTFERVKAMLKWHSEQF